jgi:HlyD family secretion protein
MRNEARVNSQREIVLELEAGTRKEEIRKAKAEVQAAREKSENATRTFKRLASLAEKDLASQQDADDARAASDVAKAQLDAAVETLNLAVAGPRKERIAAEREKLKSYQAEMEIAKQNLEDAVLRAPSDGVIRNRVLQVGDMAFPQRPVFTLALNDPVWVRAYVPEPDLGKIFEGMRAEVKTDSYPNKIYEGWVGYISPAAEFTPKTVQTPEVRTQLVYQVRVFVDNPENELRLGMPATVVIPLNQEKSDKKADSHPPESREPDERQGRP